MELAAIPIQTAMVTAGAWLFAAIGLIAAMRRGHWLTTLFFSSAFLALAAFEAGVLGMINAGSPTAARPWATYLAQVSALASWLWLALSVVLSRPDPWQQIRNAAAYLALALAGCLVMFGAAHTPYVVREVVGVRGDEMVVLGALGKIYLMYLVVVMVAVLMNFESMLRTGAASVQRRLRTMFLSFLVGILAQLLVVTGGLLSGGLKAAWMATAAAPTFGAGVVCAFALARRRLSDMSVPVARPVIYYSSVSLTLAGAFLLTMAVLSKVLPVLTPEWKHGVGLVFYLLVGGGGLMLAFSPGANRAIKRFIDRNFYANRYDYRREWERVSSAITPTARTEDVCRQIEHLVCSVFDAERVAVYLREERSTAGAPALMRCVHGPSGMAPTLELENPLVLQLERQRMALVFHELRDDLDLIPLAVENRDSIKAMSAAVVAPLAVGTQLVGLLWVSEKRSDEEFSFEDVEFLGAMGRQLANLLWFARQAEQLAETRQLESLHRLSTFVLHDIKNQVSGLSLVVENARRHLGDPEFQHDALQVVERTVANLCELMNQVASVVKFSEVRPEPCGLRGLVQEAMNASGLTLGERDGVRLRVRVIGVDVAVVDRGQMLRVLTNLLTNAREALSGPGEIQLDAEIEPAGENGGGTLRVTVRDTGRGMTEEFMRTALFRPFASTKAFGLGIGLAQCRSIVEAHGGTIAVESQLGRGTSFRVRVPTRAGSPLAAGDKR